MPDQIVVFPEKGEFDNPDAKWRWHRQDEGNYKITSTSGENFDSKDNAVRAAGDEAKRGGGIVVIAHPVERPESREEES
jgi:hypothetical protein